MMALPRRYREAIWEYNRLNPTHPFSAQTGPTFRLHQPRIDARRVPNLGMQDIINVLLDNRIPPEWMDHAYAFGLAYLEAHHSGHPIHRALFDEIDNERLARIQAHGVPNPIVAWDGWRHPSKGDVIRLHTIMETAEDRPLAPRNRDNVPDFRQGLEAPAWLLVGQDGLDHYLSSRPIGEARAYATTHHVELLQYPATLSPAPSSTIVDHGSQIPSATPAVTGDPANVGVPPSTGDTLVVTGDPVNMGVPPSTSSNSTSPANVGVGAPMDTCEGPHPNTRAM